LKPSTFGVILVSLCIHGSSPSGPAGRWFLSPVPATGLSFFSQSPLLSGHPFRATSPWLATATRSHWYPGQGRIASAPSACPWTYGRSLRRCDRGFGSQSSLFCPFLEWGSSAALTGLNDSWRGAVVTTRTAHAQLTDCRSAADRPVISVVMPRFSGASAPNGQCLAASHGDDMRAWRA
jgi:hypothetical protein